MTLTFEKAKPLIGTKDFDESWSDFCLAYERAKKGLLENEINVAWNKANTEPLPDACAEYENTAMKKLLALCFHLQREDGVFFLSNSTAGSLLERDARQAGRWLYAFSVDGFIDVIEKGTQWAKGLTPKATTYRWVWKTNCRM